MDNDNYGEVGDYRYEKQILWYNRKRHAETTATGLIAKKKTGEVLNDIKTNKQLQVEIENPIWCLWYSNKTSAGLTKYRQEVESN